MSPPIGCRTLTAHDRIQDAPIAAWLLYPTSDATPTAPVRFGPYELPLAMNATPAARQMPVVVLSHGNGGTPWSHRGLALHLAGLGSAVLMVEHPGNNRHDNSLGGPGGRTRSVLLEHRPRHVPLAIDAAATDPEVGPYLDHAAYAIVGESIGAYTALALAGGHAMTIPDHVDAATLAAPIHELAALAVDVPTTPDARVRAAVLLVPAIDFFMAPVALVDVRIPLLVRTAALDPICPSDRVGFALRSLPASTHIERAEVPGAGHFSLQTPYPPELAHIPPAQDPPGFDRAAYQQVLCADIARFLAAT